MDEITLTRALHDLAAGTPLHTAPAADARTRARRLQRQHRFTTAVAVVVVAAGAFGVRDLATDRGSTASATRHVLQIQQVTEEAKCDPALPAPPHEVKDVDGTFCYGLDPVALVLHPKSVEEFRDPTLGWTIQINLDETEAAALGSLTTKVVRLPEPQNQVAVVLDGAVVEAPAIQSPLTGGTIQVFGAGTPLTKAYADQLKAELRESANP